MIGSFTRKLNSRISSIMFLLYFSFLTVWRRAKKGQLANGFGMNRYSKISTITQICCLKLIYFQTMTSPHMQITNVTYFE